MFQPHLTMHMLTVQVNGNEMAWVIENHFKAGGEVSQTYSSLGLGIATQQCSTPACSRPSR